MRAIKQQKSPKDVKVSKQTWLHQGFCSVSQYALQHKRFDGSWTPLYTRELVIKPHAVGAIPYDPDRNQVVLIEQLRVGAIDSDQTPWLIEIVAGLMDHEPSESLQETIKREMREEAGLEVYDLIPICEYFKTPGYSTEVMHLFCARVDAQQAPKFCGLQEEHEDIKVHVVSVKDAFAAVHSGKITNATTIIALQWLELNLEDIRTRWQT